MHNQILSDRQLQMLPVVRDFAQKFYLVGGTALALQLGHRRSIDFNLFTHDSFDNQGIRNTFNSRGYQIDQVLIETKDEFTFVSSGVKFTFFLYQYNITHEVNLGGIIAMPNQLTIGAMKAFTLGRRAKWKDYVDLYFIFQQYALKDIVSLATTIFGEGEFNEKLFREQLAYHEDMNYSEQIEFLPGFEVTDQTVKSFLKEVSLQMQLGHPGFEMELLYWLGNEMGQIVEIYLLLDYNGATMDTTFTFRSIIEKDDDGYHGYVPSLAGCHTFGDTIEETKKNLKEAVLAILEAKQKLGESIDQKEEYETIQTVTLSGVAYA